LWDSSQPAMLTEREIRYEYDGFNRIILTDEHTKQYASTYTTLGMLGGRYVTRGPDGQVTGFTRIRYNNDGTWSAVVYSNVVWENGSIVSFDVQMATSSLSRDNAVHEAQSSDAQHKDIRSNPDDFNIQEPAIPGYYSETHSTTHNEYDNNGNIIHTESITYDYAHLEVTRESVWMERNGLGDVIRNRVRRSSERGEMADSATIEDRRQGNQSNSEDTLYGEYEKILRL